MSARSTAARVGRRAVHIFGIWTLLLILCLLTIGAIDATLLQLTTSYFTSGYNSVQVGGPGGAILYFLGSMLLDGALVLGVWTVVVPAAALLRASPAQTFCLAGIAAVGVPLSFNFARHNLYAHLGNRISLSALADLAAGGSDSMPGGLFAQVPRAGLLAAVAAVTLLCGLLWAARCVERRLQLADRFEPPEPLHLAGGFVLLAAFTVLLLTPPSQALASLRFGLAHKPTATLLRKSVQRLTDLDDDGFGLMSQPSDPDPFDASIHPYAIDLPGNGVDDDGIGGDLPVGLGPMLRWPNPVYRGDARPHLLLIFLESVRADVLGATLDGRPIMPALDRLAREGAHSEHAFVHTPFTVMSRAQLFGGQVGPRPDQRTLIDDFQGLGYMVAHFSGQDDSFGGSEALLGVERADVFYDARQDRERRSSESEEPASLQVSWKLLLERVFAFLDGNDPSEPLFLYVNFTDTHYPYDHPELDPILTANPIPRTQITPERADEVWRTYANAAANVDRGIGLLLARWHEHLGDRDHAVLVTADHGQAFYERGFLGHGQSLDAAQTRVPFVLWGIGGEWPEPLGLADVRGLLARNLLVGREGGVPRARFVPDVRRALFQHVPTLSRPRWIGVRRLSGSAAFDLNFRRLLVLGPRDARLEPEPVEAAARRDEVIWTWEALNLGRLIERP